MEVECDACVGEMRMKAVTTALRLGFMGIGLRETMMSKRNGRNDIIF